MYKKLLVLTIGLGWIGTGFSESLLPQPSLRLNDFITLVESTEKNESLALQFGIPAQDIDINSIVHINVNIAGFYKSIPEDLSAKWLTPHQRELLSYSGKLREALQIIDDSLTMAAQLQDITNQNLPRESKVFKELSEALQTKHNAASTEILIPYYKLLQTSPRPDYVKHGEVSRKALNIAIRDPSGNALLSEINKEITWITQELQQSGASVTQQAEQMALNLIAYTFEDGVQNFVHLPNYDDFPIGTPVNVNKLNTVPSPEELAKLKTLYAEAQRISVELNQIEDKRDALKQFLNIALTNAGIDIKALKSAVDVLVKELEKTHEWASELDRAKNRIAQVLQDTLITAERRLALQNIDALIIKLQATITKVSPSLTALERSIKGMAPKLDKAALKSRTDPLAALLTITETLTASMNAYGSVKAQLEALLNTGQAFGVDIVTVGNEVNALFDNIDPAAVGDAVTAEINEIFKQLKLEHIDRLRVAYANTETALTDIIAAMKQLDSTTQNSLNAYAATFIEPPEMSFFVPLHKAKNTYLDIRTIATREEGHVVTLQAKLYRVETANGQSVVNQQATLDEEVQQFRLLRYGLYGAYSVGLAYTESLNILEGQTDKSQTFQPTVSWIMRYRGWREPDEPARYVDSWYKTLGIGVHTVTLDLDNDNQTEIGLGVTLSILNELVQVGYGRDLSLDEDYYFIATRLLEFGKKQ